MKFGAIFLLSISLFISNSVAFGVPVEKRIEEALTGKSLSSGELIPKGFEESARTQGDLNGDGVDDMAVIVREAVKNSKSDGQKARSQDDDDDIGRQFVLLFLGKTKDLFTLWKIGGSHFMKSYEILMEPNGIGTFEIRKSLLTLETSVAQSMGTWAAGGCTQKWRMEKSGFQLIGLTVNDFWRNCACGTTKDTNFLAGVQIVESDRSASGAITKQTRKKLKTPKKVILWEDFDFESLCAS